MKPLEMLIGDDMLGSDEQKAINVQYIVPLEQDLGREINVTYCYSYKKVVEEAKKGIYEVIVTDLQYGQIHEGPYNNNEGLFVAKEINLMVAEENIPKPLLILCTSAREFDPESVSEEHKPDLYAIDNSGGIKFDVLFEKLREYSSKFT